MFALRLSNCRLDDSGSDGLVVAQMAEPRSRRRDRTGRSPYGAWIAPGTYSLLEWLYDEIVFTLDQWNGGEGENDYFLLDMFNTKKKEAITRGQSVFVGRPY